VIGDDAYFLRICVFTKQARKEKKTPRQVRGSLHYGSRELQNREYAWNRGVERALK